MEVITSILNFIYYFLFHVLNQTKSKLHNALKIPTLTPPELPTTAARDDSENSYGKGSMRLSPEQGLPAFYFPMHWAGGIYRQSQSPIHSTTEKFCGIRE